MRGIYGRLCGDFANRDRKSQHQRTNNRITQPSGAATPRNSDTHHAHRCSEGSLRSSEVPPNQGPKAAKFAVLTPGPGMFVNVRNAPRVVIPPPIRNAPCFAVCALVCDFSPKAECVPAFTRESERGPFVREAEKRDERWSEMELLLMVVVHREPGNVCI